MNMIDYEQFHLPLDLDENQVLNGRITNHCIILRRGFQLGESLKIILKET
jgi:hypothetical protein